MKYTRGSKPVGQTVNGGNRNYFWKSTWNIGLTEIGTSGAPWFDHNRRIIGQHYSGTSNGCESTNFGYAGRFDKSWDVGSYSSGPFANLKLKNILDPNNTNILRTNSVGMCFPIEGTINGALVSTSTNQVAAYQTHTLVITNTPWASNYTFQIISGSNATVTSSGNHCYINVTGYGNFTIRVTVRNARRCTKTRDITFGAYNYLLSSYPNPASDKIVVSLNEKESLDVDQIRLTGLNGVTEIPKFQVIDQNFEIDVTTLPNGLYILEAINGKMIYRKTIMIKR